MSLLYVVFAAGLLGWGLTGLVLLAAERTRLIAEPTDRGLHKIATPIGGGFGLIGATLAVWLMLDRVTPPLGWPILAAIGLLAAVSWMDDRKPQPPALRFAAQAAAVALVLWHIPAALRVVPVLPVELERLGLLIGWMWMINLTNFMDGIDGIAGMEAIAIGVGYALVSHFSHAAPALFAHLPQLALILAAAAAGYLFWNWAPARIFMGDVGAIPLGMMFGLLMLDLAARGLWAAALIIPLYFVADTTLTLFERLRRGSKPWQAHREHAYQRAVLGGMTHDAVTLHVAALNVALVALAVLSVRHPWPALVAASVLTFALRTWLASRAPDATAKPAER
jgi:UDP-N-acetylmuramyl pentapeptide phosphotransferase/UDP-N-acetylglucosamine-1-phosphate transferase